jgi:hypothetical protein
MRIDLVAHLNPDDNPAADIHVELPIIGWPKTTIRHLGIAGFRVRG